jgi:sortase B
MKKRRIRLIILLLLLSAVCLASLTMAWKEYADQASDRHAFDELAELVEKPEETTVPATDTESTDTTEDTTEETTNTETEPEPTEQKRNLAPIMEQNSECIGWIYIEGTAVNYPVMHTPSDPQKYLRMNFEKKYSVSGIPFLDYRCTPHQPHNLRSQHEERNYVL